MDFKNLITKELSSSTSNLLMTKSIDRVSKKEDLCIRARELGNQEFRARGHNAEVHERILHCYSASLALAPSDSEHLAFAYGNKSALLLHLQKFEDCVKDIDRALKLAVTSNSLRVKLLCRKIECYIALGKLEGRQEMLEEIDKCLGLIGGENEETKKLWNMVDKIKVLMTKEHSEVTSEDYETEHLRVRALKESKGVFDSICLTHDTKYSHHLIATENIEPGQLIFVSKPYTAVANLKQFQSYCAHCVNVIWSSVPCENCGFSLYCSEECRDEAKNSYHELECRCLQFILCESLIDYQIHVAVRSVIMAVKEFGSIEALLELVREVDNMPEGDKGFDNENKFNIGSFRSLLGFSNVTDTVGPTVLDALIKASCRAIIALARYTSFFGDVQEFKQISDLLNNPNVLFIGALLLRISLIVFKKGHKISEGSTACKNNQDQVTCSSSIPCCERGYSINVLDRFVPHSCNPNVRSVRIEGGKELWYALQPIAKGQPLLDCYKVTFFEMDKPRRSFIISQVINRDCNCIACENNWPAVLAPGGRIMTYQDMSHIMVEGIKNQKICGKFLIMIGENERYTQATVNDLIKIMSAMFEVETQPSKLLCCMICILRFVFDRLHGIKLRIPNQCRSLPS